MHRRRERPEPQVSIDLTPALDDDQDDTLLTVSTAPGTSRPRRRPPPGPSHPRRQIALAALGGLLVGGATVATVQLVASPDREISGSTTVAELREVREGAAHGPRRSRPRRRTVRRTPRRGLPPGRRHRGRDPETPVHRRPRVRAAGLPAVRTDRRDPRAAPRTHRGGGARVGRRHRGRRCRRVPTSGPDDRRVRASRGRMVGGPREHHGTRRPPPAHPGVAARARAFRTVREGPGYDEGPPGGRPFAVTTGVMRRPDGRRGGGAGNRTPVR